MPKGVFLTNSQNAEMVGAIMAAIKPAVVKAVDDYLGKQPEAETEVVNRVQFGGSAPVATRQPSNNGFKLPRSDAYRAPEGE